MNGRDSKDLVIHGLRIVKRWESMCLDQMIYEQRVGVGGSNK
jgi:hypothetical protein